jgi:hypothetical protein
VRSAAALLLCAAACGFDPDAGEDALWATPEQIVEAAERCGIRDFKPTKANARWAAYVPGEDAQTGVKTSCIYDDLQRQGLLATR